jgi:hypothetical protein
MVKIAWSLAAVLAVCLVPSGASSEESAAPEFTFWSELDGATFQRYEAPSEPTDITVPPGFAKWQCTLDSLQREDAPDGRGYVVRGGFACSEDGSHVVNRALARLGDARRDRRAQLRGPRELPAGPPLSIARLPAMNVPST